MPVSIGIDLGGSLCKLSLLTSSPTTLPLSHLFRTLKHLGGQSIFIHLLPGTPQNISSLTRHLVALAKREPIIISLTGGGAHKHKRLLRVLHRNPNIEVVRCEDEFMCLTKGIRFLASSCESPGIFELADFHFHGDIGSARATIDKKAAFLPASTPLLMVNIGTGTSFVDVPSHGVFKRVGGSSLGGGTFMGLCRGLTRSKSFKEALKLAALGDSRKVDMLVGDIFGGEGEAEQHGLRSTVLASSFAKLGFSDDSGREDRALSALIMISMNLAAMAWLHARICNRNVILFTGTFLQDNPMALRTMAYAIHFWSKGDQRSLFVESSAFMCSLGALANVVSDKTPEKAKL